MRVPAGWNVADRRVDPRLLLRILEILLAVAVLVQAARLAWTVFGPLDRPGVTVTVPLAAAEPRFTGFDPFFRNGGSPDVPSAAGGASGGLVLYGVRTGGGVGSAIIAGPDGAQRSYGVGDAVQPGLVLRSVAFDHVVLARGGATLKLTFPDGPAGVAAAPPAAASVFTPAAAPPLIQRFLNEADLQPRLQDGRVRGYVLQLRPGAAALQRAGLRTGDVLTRVNEQALSPETLEGLGAGLAGASELTVTYEREGRTGSAVLRSDAP